MKRFLGFCALLFLGCLGAAQAVGTSATLTWTFPTTYIDGTALPATDIASVTVKWYRPGATTPTGSVTVAAPTTSTVVSGLVCGSFNFTALVTTSATATYPSAGSSEAAAVPTPYVTGVACSPNPPGLTAK